MKNIILIALLLSEVSQAECIITSTDDNINITIGNQQPIDTLDLIVKASPNTLIEYAIENQQTDLFRIDGKRAVIGEDIYFLNDVGDKIFDLSKSIMIDGTGYGIERIWANTKEESQYYKAGQVTLTGTLTIHCP